MGRDTFHYPRLLPAPSNPALDASRNGDATGSLGDPCQGLTILLIAASGEQVVQERVSVSQLYVTMGIESNHDAREAKEHSSENLQAALGVPEMLVTVKFHINAVFLQCIAFLNEDLTLTCAIGLP